MAEPGHHLGRALPGWFDEARFCRFVQWTGATVPAFRTRRHGGRDGAAVELPGHGPASSVRLRSAGP